MTPKFHYIYSEFKDVITNKVFSEDDIIEMIKTKNLNYDTKGNLVKFLVWYNENNLIKLIKELPEFTVDFLFFKYIDVQKLFEKIQNNDFSNLSPNELSITIIILYLTNEFDKVHTILDNSSDEDINEILFIMGEIYSRFSLEIMKKIISFIFKYFYNKNYNIEKLLNFVFTLLDGIIYEITG